MTYPVLSEKYIFQTVATSCPICESHDGELFAEEPGRPHDSCDCDIIPLEEAGLVEGGSWYILDSDTERYGDQGSSFLFTLTIVVECANGEVHRDSVEVDFGDDAQYKDDENFVDYLEDLIWLKAEERAEEIAASNCNTRDAFP